MKKTIVYVIVLSLVVIGVVLGHTTRNYLIIRKMQDKILEYSNKDSYSIITTSKDLENNGKTIMEYYKDGSNEVMKVNSNHDGKEMSYCVYKSEGQAKIYTIDESGKKIYTSDEDFVMQVSFYNLLESSSNLSTFIGTIPTTVISKNINGKECYEINNFRSDMSMTEVGKNVIYVEKDTGLLVEQDTQTTIITKEYSFDKIDSSIFIEPDISEYERIEE